MLRAIRKKLQNTGLFLFVFSAIIICVSIPLFIGITKIAEATNRNMVQTYGETMFQLLS